VATRSRAAVAVEAVAEHVAEVAPALAAVVECARAAAAARRP
jgi:hypothetical protein